MLGPADLFEASVWSSQPRAQLKIWSDNDLPHFDSDLNPSPPQQALSWWLLFFCPSFLAFLYLWLHESFCPSLIH